jgi:3',5'-cyclic AMP phosphodiesterase CpdA
MPEPEPPKEPVKPRKRAFPLSFVLQMFLQILISAILFGVVVRNLGPLTKVWVNKESQHQSKFVPPTEGTWRFIVSGDSRNCGDVVMPAIANQGIEKFQPAFYWHLGDLRAIYKIDEDMAAATEKAGQHLSCEAYHKSAWQDFIDHQIVPFGTTRFYLGIGNHEVIPPKNAAEFSSTFQDWLLTPRLLMQSQERQEITSARTGACQKIASRPYLSSTPYYHWIRGGIDFIYLDNSSGAFLSDQLDWFDCILERAHNNQAIQTVVVGMHEALPLSRASSHAMCDDAIQDAALKKQSCDSGKHVYDALVEFMKTKRVYVLASHSHFYMKGIFENQPAANRLDGWIVGTAGAVRYPLPQGTSPGPDAIADRYGYLLGTVQGGNIEFQFQPVAESDAPQNVRRQYPQNFISWCFAKNSHNLDPESDETTNRCNAPVPSASAIHPSHK